MSRSHGDLDLHVGAGLSAEPDVSEYSLSSEDQVLLVCSDGVWTYMTHSEAVNVVLEFDRCDAMQAAHALAKASRDSWMQNSEYFDDITVLCIFPGVDAEGA